MKLTIKQQAELLEEEELLLGNTLLVLEETKILHMDSHGYNVTIAVVSCYKSGNYDSHYGFRYLANSDMNEYFDPAHLVKMKCEEVTIDQYTRQDGKDWE